MCTLVPMMLAGVSIRPELVRELAARVDESTASLLERAQEREIAVVALSIEDRERILRALDDPPAEELAHLRAVLLQEHEWRVREKLVRPT